MPANSTNDAVLLHAFDRTNSPQSDTGGSSGVKDFVQSMIDERKAGATNTKLDTNAKNPAMLCEFIDFTNGAPPEDVTTKDGHRIKQNDDGTKIEYEKDAAGKERVCAVAHRDGSTSHYGYDEKGNLNSISEINKDGKVMGKYDSTNGQDWKLDSSIKDDKMKKEIHGTFKVGDDGTFMFTPSGGSGKDTTFACTPGAERYKILHKDDQSDVEIHTGGDGKPHVTSVKRHDGTESRYAYDNKGRLNGVEEYVNGDHTTTYKSNDGLNWVKNFGPAQFPNIVSGQMSVDLDGTYRFSDGVNSVTRKTNDK